MAAKIPLEHLPRILRGGAAWTRVEAPVDLDLHRGVRIEPRLPLWEMLAMMAGAAFVGFCLAVML